MKEDFPIWDDLNLSVFFAIIITLLCFFTKITYSFDGTDFGIFITILGIILGVLFTVLTVLYAFEDNIKNSIVIKELRQSEKYKLIYPIFIDSISIIFYSLILLMVAYFLRDFIWDRAISYLYFFYIIFLLSISFIRAYRCFFVFSLLQKVTLADAKYGKKCTNTSMNKNKTS